MLTLRKRADRKRKPQKINRGKIRNDSELSTALITDTDDPRSKDLQSVGTDPGLSDSRGFAESGLKFNEMESTFASFNSILKRLKGPEISEKKNAASDLEKALIVLVHEIPSDQFQKFSNVLNNKIFELIHSSNSIERMGGVFAVDALVDFYTQTDEIPSQSARLANYLRVVIPSNDVEVMRLAASTLGKLTISGNASNAEFVDYEVRNCIEWLTLSHENVSSGSRQEYRGYAAILIIKALADNSPYLLYQHLDLILQNIWKALRDSKLPLRMDAALTLGRCLTILNNRDASATKLWVQRLYDECFHGFDLNTNDAIHASLLVFRELLKLRTNLMKSKFNQTYNSTVKYVDHKYDVIRYEAYTIIPLLAAFDPNLFTRKYLTPTFTHFIAVLKVSDSNAVHETDKAYIFVSIGDIALEVRGSISQYIRPIVDNIKEGLRAKYKIRRYSEREIFYCIGKLAQAIGPVFSKFLKKDLLELCLSCGLTEHLREMVMLVVNHIPSLERYVQARLLRLISCYLSGIEDLYNHTNVNFSEVSHEKARGWRNTEMLNIRREVNSDVEDEKILTQAFEYLIEVRDWDSNAEVMQIVVVSYIGHKNKVVRKLASIATCKLYALDTGYDDSSFIQGRIAEVLSKLLVVAITDPVSEIRLEVIRNLRSKFDPHLAQPDNVRLLCVLLNDESFTIQLEAVRLLGRLSSTYSAYVVPSLQNYLLELLSQVQYTTLASKREEAATLLCTLITHGSDVAQAYVGPIMEVLLPLFRDNSSSVSSTILKVIGELAVVSGSEMKHYIDSLMPVIIKSIEDQSNVLRREVALKTLIKLSTNTQYVIEPLLDYPKLLSTLIHILKTDINQNVKRAVVQSIGILGALDPYKYREIEVASNTKHLDDNLPSVDIALLMTGITPSNSKYYPTVVIRNLEKILKDVSLTSHHPMAVQTIMHIFQLFENNCVQYLDIVIPAVILVMEVCPPSFLEFYFQQLTNLISLVKADIKHHVKEIYEVIKKYFGIVKLQLPIITLIETISKALERSFKEFIPDTLNLFLKVLENDNSNKKIVSMRILKALVVFDTSLEYSAHLIIPTITRLAEFAPANLNKVAIVSLGKLAKTTNISDVTSRIIQVLLRILKKRDQDLVKSTMNSICLILLQLGKDFLIYIPIINKALIQAQIQHNVYDQLSNKLLNGDSLPTNIVFDKETDDQNNTGVVTDYLKKTLKTDQNLLKSSWNTVQQRSKEDWVEWFRRFSIQLVKESPSHAVRSCSNLVSVYYPLARELFNASFRSCWGELQRTYQEDLINSLCHALSSPENPPEIYHTLLNLVEFMEHDQTPLPIPTKTLGYYSQNCHAYAKALHYKEVEFLEKPQTSIIEALIDINNHLRQTDAAIGTLKYAQQHHNLQLKETWYEKLQRWEDALEAYEQREKLQDHSTELTMGKLRALSALGEWENLSHFAESKWSSASLAMQQSMAPLAAGAAWSLDKWGDIEKYVNVLESEGSDKKFLQAILCIHTNNLEKATEHIDTAKDLLVSELSALANESYSRTYNVVVRAQIVSEVEEVIAYKKLSFMSEKREQMKKTWNKRLMGCQKNVDVWQRILHVRSLVLEPKENEEVWIKFANLCRKSGRMNLAKKTLDALMKGYDESIPNEIIKTSPKVVYAQLKYLWGTGKQEQAVEKMEVFATKFAAILGVDPKNVHDLSSVIRVTKRNNEHWRLLARCFLKFGQWKVSLYPEWRLQSPEDVLGPYFLATQLDSTWYKAWHNWALANFEVISATTTTWRKNDDEIGRDGPVGSVYQISDEKVSIESKSAVNDNDVNKMVRKHILPAIKGFFYSISLSNLSTLQDALRVLTLWFTFGGIPEVAQAMQEGFNMVQIETWLEVTPQLISRIHQQNQMIHRSLLALLSDLGKVHPHMLVYPLTVAVKSESVSRQRAALSLVERMRSHSPVLVDQAELISAELIRVAVLWHEQWHEGLEAASRYFFGDNDIEKMLQTIEPLYAMLDRGPETLREISFKNLYGRELVDAFKWLTKYKGTHDISNLHQAWDIFYSVFRKISKQLPQLQEINLKHVSPKLLAAKNLEVVVPGTYSTDEPAIKIVEFDPVFTIIASKQRPRKFSIKGSDGKSYMYALKGHEDIRQDSLVMQLFGLVNTLLQNDPECFRRHLDIEKYPAIPLSPKSGLLGWVPNSDTFHVLIKQYREPRNISMNIEHWIMLQMAPDYENLTLLQKLEVFNYAMDNTKGQDLYNVLWLKSRSSESWLERRTIYTRSLAVMSMVGYILGLGDRHPSNLMLNRSTGKVIHIDFGDCFEAAVLRDKFPEKVPFRLTRTLILAMEVSGVEGSFRITCENVMRVLRSNKDSLMAILEAFVFDPLINWGFDLPSNKENDIDAVLESNPQNFLGSTSVPVFADNLKIGDNRDSRAIFVIRRIAEKLNGNDFRRPKKLGIADQVDKLIMQATDSENLCQHYIGWCPFW